MLILSRRVDEVICIGPDIEVMVCEIVGSQVRIGITAPKETIIMRSELLRPPVAEAACDEGEAL